VKTTTTYRVEERQPWWPIGAWVRGGVSVTKCSDLRHVQRRCGWAYNRQTLQICVRIIKIETTETIVQGPGVES